MFQLESFIPYLAISIFGTVMQAVTASEWITLKWKSANITNHDLQRALRASYEDALNSINFAFRQKTGLLDKLGKNRLHKEVTITFNDQFLNPFVAEKKLSPEELRNLALNCSDYCKLLRSSVDTVLPLAEISEVTIEDLLLTGRNLKGADDLYRLNSRATEELMEKVRRVDGIPDLFCELLAYRGLLLGSIVFFFNERIKSDERVRSILTHSELQHIREEQNRQHHQQVALLEEALQSKTNRFTTSLSPIKENFSEVLNSLERVEAELAQNTKYLERIYDMLCQDRGLSDKERRQLQAGLSTTFSLHDKYDFDESTPIGYGSVAVVYKVVHKGIKQVRALKLLKPEHKNNPEVVERFLREAIALGSLTHPNIVRIYDAGGGGPDLQFYLEMEYIEGTTLRDWIRAKPFNWDATLKLITQLCSTIQKIHGAGIIHRDLNPRNIMVDKGNNLKVMDFGVAKIIGVEGLTRDGQVVGTHDYMAPEQARGERIDERADIYSFGVIVYELCTKRMPSIPPLPLQQYQSKVPQWLEDIVAKCLAQERDARYQSIGHILSDIEVNARYVSVEEKRKTSRKYKEEETFIEQPDETTIQIPAQKRNIDIKPEELAQPSDSHGKWMLPLVLSFTIVAIITVGFIFVLDQLKTATPPVIHAPVTTETQNHDWPMFAHDLERTGSSDEIIGERMALLWVKKTSSLITYSSPAVVDDKVYIGVGDSIMCFPNTDNKSIIWEYKTGQSVESSPAYYDYKVFVGSRDSYVYCLNSNNGNLIWKYKTEDMITESSPAIYSDKVFFGSWDNYVYCLNSNNGNLVWRYNTGYPISSSPAISNGKIFASSSDGYIYCLNSNDGSLIWKSKTQGGDPSVSADRVYIVGGGNENSVYCLNALDGSLVWKYKAGDFMSHCPAISDGRVFISCADSYIYCLSAHSGSLIWRYKTGYWIDSSPAVSNGKVFVGSKDCYFYCLNADNGHLLWKYKTEDMIESSPAISNGKVYISSHNGNIYCFDAR